MTKTICSHHFWGLVWLGLGLVLAYFIYQNSSIMSDYGFNPPNIGSDEQSVSDFHRQFSAYIGLEFSILLFVALNLTGLFFANERYGWVGLRECTKTQEGKSNE